jgi:hypothetical protein
MRSEGTTMIARSLLSVTVALLAAVAPVIGAEAPKSIRTLVYAIAYAARTRNEEHTSGFTGKAGGPANIAEGNAAVERVADVNDDGTLTIEVIAATSDGGLVVDSTFAGRATNQPSIRVAIFPDGRLSYDPRAVLSVEATHVLPLLARGVIAGRDVSPGSSWTTAVPYPAARGSTIYHVTHVEGDRADLAIESEMTESGPRGFSEHGHGTATYATDRLCPLLYELQAQSRHQPTPEQYVTATAHLTAKLVSDTFAKHPS